MDERFWVVESANVLFSHPRVTVIEESLRLPDGRLVDGYLQIVVGEHVVIVVRSDDGKLLLQRQYKHGPRAVSLTFPAGGIERGEHPVNAAQRELQEETGLRAADWRYFGRFVVNGNQSSGAAHLLLAERIQDIGQPLNAAADLEQQDILWLSENELVAASKSGHFKVFSHAIALGFALNPKLWPDS
jgi:ADP-ribose pyrophosphatase